MNWKKLLFQVVGYRKKDGNYSRVRGMEIHHTIPISMEGEDVPENRIVLSPSNHRKLHKEQDVQYRMIRQARMDTNSMKSKNKYFFSVWIFVWKSFFVNAKTDKKKQTMSLNRLIDRHSVITGSKIMYKGNDIDRLLDEYARLRSMPRK